jgi:hypothetical protein
MLDLILRAALRNALRRWIPVLLAVLAAGLLLAGALLDLAATGLTLAGALVAALAAWLLKRWGRGVGRVDVGTVDVDP